MHRHRSTRSSLAVVLAAAMLFGACGSDDSGSDPTTAPATTEPATSSPDTSTSDTSEPSTSEPSTMEPSTSEPAAECPSGGDGTLDVATYIGTLGLDPLRASGGSYGGLELMAIYDTLTRWNAEAGAFEPWLAEALEPDDSYTTWELTLRSGVTFSDGTALTAEVVKASIERQQDPENTSNLRNLVTPIVEMTVGSDTELTFVLDGPWPDFPFALANTPGMITNPASVGPAGDRETLDANAAAGAGVGPYVVERYVPGEELVLTAREGYWGGQVCIPEVRFTHITGGPATYEALQAGEIDVAVLRDPAAIAEARADGVDRYSWVMNLGEVLLVNHGVKGTTPATADVTVRQAIAAAIDTSRVDTAATGGLGIPGSSLFASGGALDPGVPGPAYDPEHAAELVAEAKAAGWDGEIDLSCDNARTRQDISISVAAQLEAAGITVNLDNSRSINDHVARALEGNYELACWGINVNDVGAWAKLDKQLGGASTSNFAGFVDDAWDAALADLRTAATVDDQLAATAVLQERANETIPVIVLAAAEEVIAVRDGIDGLVPSNETLLLFGEATMSS